MLGEKKRLLRLEVKWLKEDLETQKTAFKKMNQKHNSLIIKKDSEIRKLKRRINELENGKRKK